MQQHEQAATTALQEKLEKQKWINEWNRLRSKYVVCNFTQIRETMLCKEIESCWNNPRLHDLREILDEIIQVQHVNAKERGKEGNIDEQFYFLGLQLAQFCKLAHDNVTKLHSLVISKMNNQQAAVLVERIQHLMEQVEDDLLQFKQKQKEKYEIWSNEEKHLFKELTQFETGMDHWQSETEMKKPLRIQTQNQQQQQVVQLPEIEAYDNFLQQHGGLTFGWDEPDHAKFLQLRTKLKGAKEIFFTRCVQEIPDQTLYTVQDHEEYYQKHQVLLLQKKNAIAKWRAQMELEKEEKRKQDESSETDIERLAQEDENKKKREALARQEQKKKLQEWKLTKALEENLQQQVEQRQIELVKQEAEEAKQRKKQQIHLELEEFKRKRDEEKMLKQKLALEERRKSPRPPSRVDLEKLHQRDANLLQKKQQAKQDHEQKKQEIQERLNKLASQVVVHAERDKNRLYQHTQAHAQRITEQIKNGTETDAVACNFNIRRVQHRSTPVWMKPMS